MEEEYDYYKLELIKRSYTDAYIKVPKGERLTIRDCNRFLPETIEQTIEDCDWDDFNYQHDCDIDNFSKVSEEEATVYAVYDATDYFPKRMEIVHPDQLTLNFKN